MGRKNGTSVQRVMYFLPPAIDQNGTIYFGSSYDNNLYAVDPNGTEKWNFSTESYVLSTPAIDENGTIYFGSFDGNVSALDPDGTEKWSYQTDGPVVSSPAITDSGRIYVASYNGTLYAQQ